MTIDSASSTPAIEKIDSDLWDAISSLVDFAASEADLAANHPEEDTRRWHGELKRQAEMVNDWLDKVVCPSEAANLYKYRQDNQTKTAA
jgi:hypothetical protein